MVEARFFVVRADQFQSGKPIMIHADNGDILGLADIQTYMKVNNQPLIKDGIEYVIVFGVVSRATIKALEFQVDEGVEPLSIEALQAIGAVNCYCGRDYSNTPYVGVFWFIQARFGVDWSREYQDGVDEEGQPVMVTYLVRASVT